MDSHALPMFCFLCIAFFSFNFNNVSSASDPSYKHHCEPSVPEATPNTFQLYPVPIIPDRNVYYIGGGGRILDGADFRVLRKSVYFSKRVHGTDMPGLFKVEGALHILLPFIIHSGKYAPFKKPLNHRVSLSFHLKGFWSASSRKLCMVGTGTGNSKVGNLLHLSAVLKLYNMGNSSDITSLISGKLESLSPKTDDNYFEPISLLIFPSVNYEYKLVSEEADDRIGIPKGLPIDSLPGRSFCSAMGLANKFDLGYFSDCHSEKNCSPLGKNIGYLPHSMSLKQIGCDGFKQRMRVLLEFHNDSNTILGYPLWPFNLNSTLVGEGWWDDKNNQLYIVACRLIGAHVGDCSTRMSLWFTSVWSIRDTSGNAGQIWTNKTVDDPGYFKKIVFQSYWYHRGKAQGLKYEYSKLDRVRKSCPARLTNLGPKRTFPDVNSFNMRFDMYVKRSERRIGWGYASPLFLGTDRPYGWFWYSMPLHNSTASNSLSNANFNSKRQFNVSYEISISFLANSSLVSRFSLLNRSSNSSKSMKITAEGIYDAETGRLCMIGCRNLGPLNQIPTSESLDCEILVKFQFPSIDAKNKAYTEGSIESTREETDPLHFKHLDVSSAAYSVEVAKKAIKTANMEIIMVLISTTLACVFVGLQLYHVKKNSDALPFISLVMLSILTMGHMIPLMLNFEAFFKQNPNKRNIFLGRSGWLEVNEISIRLILMAAFLMQFRLLQQTWSARIAQGNQKGICGAEKKSSCVTFPIYSSMFLIALLVSWKKNNKRVNMYFSSSIWWEGLKAFGGLVLDGFLVPQIILNLFNNSRENALSCSFYIGTSFVRALPHVFHLYKAHSYFNYSDGSHIDGGYSADLYSTLWDIVIPLGGLFFASIIYLQQMFGGQCILPQRFRSVEVYEKVPEVTEDEEEK